MRIFQNFTEMHSEIGRDLVEMGVQVNSASVQGWKAGERFSEEDLLMKEVIGYTYKLEGCKGWQEFFDNDEHHWLYQEQLDRVNPEFLNPGTSYGYLSDFWSPMLRDNGMFDYTYNERFRLQLPLILNELKLHPNSRQAVLVMYESKDQKGYGGNFRIPCTLSYQFLIREGKVHCIYHMRSCDYFNHFKFDVMLAWALMEHVSSILGYETGYLTHIIGSFHCFKKDWVSANIF